MTEELNIWEFSENERKKREEKREAFERNQHDIKNKNAINKALVEYSKIIVASIEKLWDRDKILKFLKREYERLISERIKAQHKNNKYDIDYHQRAIAEIEERIKLWEEKKESEKKPEKSEIKFEVKKATASNKLSVKKKPEPESKVSAIANDDLPENFSKIKCNASKDEILFYFMILTKEKNSAQKFYMTKKDVLRFLKKNFAEFKYTPTKNTKFPINLKAKATLTYFIFRFYKNYDRKENLNKIKYIRLLINNFTEFENEKEEDLGSNMGDSHIPKNKANVIPIDKHFPDKKML